MQEELKPCPFCGLTEKETVSADSGMPAVLLNEFNIRTFAVRCDGCGCTGPVRRSGVDAIIEWNTRETNKEDTFEFAEWWHYHKMDWDTYLEGIIFKEPMSFDSIEKAFKYWQDNVKGKK